MKNGVPGLDKQKIKNHFNKAGYDDHRWPVTRRDFLRAGLFAAAYSVLPKVSWAKASPGRNIPILIFDCAGGISMPGNFLVGGVGGPLDLLQDYNSHGWNPRESGSLDQTYGLPLSAQRSQILKGLNQVIPQNIRAQFKLGSFCHFSLDDTSQNPLSAVHLIGNIHGGGAFLRNGFSSVDSDSGGNSIAVPSNKGSFKPASFQSLEQVLDLGKMPGGLGQQSANDLASFLNYLKSTALPSQVISSAEPLLNSSTFDPRQDKGFFDLYRNSENGGQIQLEAAIVFNTLKNNCGASVITIGGCDYHEGTPINQAEAIDLEIGRKIGRAVAAAAYFNTPLFIQVVTDGGCYAPDSGHERRWLGDSNVRSLSLIGYFDPHRSPEQRRLQVGSYLPSGIVNQDTTIGSQSTLSKVPVAVAANYLSLNNRLGELADWTGSRGLSNEELESYLIF